MEWVGPRHDPPFVCYQFKESSPCPSNTFTTLNLRGS